MLAPADDPIARVGTSSTKAKAPGHLVMGIWTKMALKKKHKLGNNDDP
jgi:hypothetical protein